MGFSTLATRVSWFLYNLLKQGLTLPWLCLSGSIPQFMIRVITWFRLIPYLEYIILKDFICCSQSNMEIWFFDQEVAIQSFLWMLQRLVFCINSLKIVLEFDNWNRITFAYSEKFTEPGYLMMTVNRTKVFDGFITSFNYFDRDAFNLTHNLTIGNIPGIGSFGGRMSFFMLKQAWDLTFGKHELQNSN